MVVVGGWVVAVEVDAEVTGGVVDSTGAPLPPLHPPQAVTTNRIEHATVEADRIATPFSPIAVEAQSKQQPPRRHLSAPQIIPSFSSTTGTATGFGPFPPTKPRNKKQQRRRCRSGRPYGAWTQMGRQRHRGPSTPSEPVWAAVAAATQPGVSSSSSQRVPSGVGWWLSRRLRQPECCPRRSPHRRRTYHRCPTSRIPQAV